jgi:hypothetical protein
MYLNLAKEYAGQVGNSHYPDFMDWFMSQFHTVMDIQKANRPPNPRGNHSTTKLAELGVTHALCSWHHDSYSRSVADLGFLYLHAKYVRIFEATPSFGLKPRPFRSLLPALPIQSLHF